MATETQSPAQQLVRPALIEGESQIRGHVLSADANECAVRLATGEVVTCHVEGEVAREIVRRVYQEVILTGRARWLQPSWQLYDFTIHSVADVPTLDAGESFQALYDFGGRYWDAIDDPAAFLGSLR